MDGQDVSPAATAADSADSRTEALRRRRELAMASIERERLRREAAGFVAGAAIMNFTAANEPGSLLARAVHASKLFLIAFVCVAPNYLVWRLLLAG
ncbi:hypothetical protein [Rhodosalinus sp. FB01]|uniref:hypothetical protein n=2 Tax=Rhodosalinus TaxID=2047740 RepID=UPI003524283D